MSSGGSALSPSYNHTSNLFHDKNPNNLNSATAKESRRKSSLKSKSIDPEILLLEKERYENFWSAVVASSAVHIENPNLMYKRLQHHKESKENSNVKVFLPSEPWKIMWDVGIIFVMVYTLIAIPFSLSFSINDNLNFQLIDWLINAVFLFDVCIYFNLAYVDARSGELVTDRSAIAANYLKFWFWIDVLSCIPFDAALSSLNGPSNSSKLVRLIRLTRLTKLLKIVRTSRFKEFELYFDKHNSVLLRYFKIIAQVMLLAHVVACFWYYITTSDVLNGNSSIDITARTRTWVSEFGFYHQSVSAKYVASLYWVLFSLVSVGFGDIHAVNTRERVFTIFTLLAGTVMLGAVISQISRIVAASQPHRRAFKAKIDELKIYLKSSLPTLPREIKFKVIEAYSYYLRKRTAYEEKYIYNQLPHSLLSKLVKHVYSQERNTINFFRNGDSGFVTDMIHHTVPFSVYAGEKICLQDDVATNLFFIMRGLVRIIVHDGTHEVVIGYITQGNHFGDMEITMKTGYVATYEAVVPCALLSLSVEALHEAIGRNIKAGVDFETECRQKYKNFVQVMKKDVIESSNCRSTKASRRSGLDSFLPTLNTTQSVIRKIQKSPNGGLGVIEKNHDPLLTDYEEKPAFSRESSRLSRHNSNASNEPKLGYFNFSGRLSPMVSLSAKNDKKESSRFKNAVEDRIENILSSPSQSYFGSFLSPKGHSPTLDEKINSPEYNESTSGGKNSHLGALKKSAESKSASQSPHLEKQLRDIIIPTRRSSLNVISPKQGGNDANLRSQTPKRRISVNNNSNKGVTFKVESKPSALPDINTKVEYLNASGLSPTYPSNNEASSRAVTFVNHENGNYMPPVGSHSVGKPIITDFNEPVSQDCFDANAPRRDNRKYLWVNGAVQDLKSFTQQIEGLFQQQIAPYRVLVEKNKNGILSTEVIEFTVKDMFKRYYIIHPNVELKQYWDLFIGLFIVYSIIVLPLEIAFNLSHIFQLEVLDFVVDSVFLIDLMLSSRLSYFDDSADAWVCIPTMIRLHYLKTWFIVDFLSCIPFDSIVLAAANYQGQFIGAIRLLKVFRLFRLVKLFQIAHVSDFVNKFEHFTGLSPLVLELVRVVIQILVIAHFVACIWWGLTSNITDDHWYDQISQVYDPLHSVGEQYVTSLYFAVTTLSSTGYGDIVPINTLERIVTIFLILIGAILFAFVVSLMASIMGDLTHDVVIEKLKHVENYMEDKQCHAFLKDAILTHLERKYKRESNVNEEIILSCLPPALAIHLFTFHHGPIMSKISLFNYLENDSLRMHVFKLLTPEYFDKDHVLIKHGKVVKEIFFVVDGTADILYVKPKKKPRKQATSQSKFFDIVKLATSQRKTNESTVKSKFKRIGSWVVRRTSFMRSGSKTSTSSIESLSAQGPSERTHNDDGKLETSDEAQIYLTSERSSLESVNNQPIASTFSSRVNSGEFFRKSSLVEKLSLIHKESIAVQNPKPSLAAKLFGTIEEEDERLLSSRIINNVTEMNEDFSLDNRPSFPEQNFNVPVPYEEQYTPVLTFEPLNSYDELQSEVNPISKPMYSKTVILACLKFKELLLKAQERKMEDEKDREYKKQAKKLATQYGALHIGNYEDDDASSSSNDSDYLLNDDLKSSGTGFFSRQDSSKKKSTKKEFVFISKVNPPDVLGLSAVINKAKSNVIVKATSSCRVFSLRVAMIRELIENQPSVAFHLQIALGKILKQQQLELSKRHIRSTREQFLAECKKSFLEKKKQEVEKRFSASSKKSRNSSAFGVPRNSSFQSQSGSNSLDASAHGIQFVKQQRLTSLPGDMNNKKHSETSPSGQSDVLAIASQSAENINAKELITPELNTKPVPSGIITSLFGSRQRIASSEDIDSSKSGKLRINSFLNERTMNYDSEYSSDCDDVKGPNLTVSGRKKIKNDKLGHLRSSHFKPSIKYLVHGDIAEEKVAEFGRERSQSFPSYNIGEWRSRVRKLIV